MNLSVESLGINAIGTRHSGAAIVLLDLLRGLLTLPEPEEIVVFASPAQERRFEFPRSERLQIVDCPTYTGDPVRRFIWLQTRFDSWIRAFGCDVVLNLNNLAGKITVPQILFIQQSLYFSQEALNAYKSLPGFELKRWRILAEAPLIRLFMRISAKRSDRVVVQTQTMREWLIRWLQLDDNKVAVIPPIIQSIQFTSDDSAILDPLRDDRFRHFLYVGSSAPYKNLEVVFSVAKLAFKKKKNWRFYVTIDILQAVQNSNLMALGTLDRNKLFEAYRLIDALIMPSLVETVGLPMLEAMVAGKPVIAVDRPYAHEICGDAALYFDPHSVSSLYRNLDAIVNDHEVRRLVSDARRKHLTFFPKLSEAGLLWLNAINSVT